MAILSNRVALVTGGGSGIGKAISAELARRGCDLAVNDIRAEAAAATANELRALSRRALGVPADVSVSEAVDAMVGRVLEEYGRLDILVNNAGIAPKGLMDELPDEVWHKTIGTHLHGTFYCSRAAARAMKEQKAGRIINISSVVARRIAPYTSVAYTAAKAGILGFTRQAAFELGPFGITVNAVCPGQTLTPLRESIVQSAEFVQRDLERIPLGRFATPRDIAAVVAFLASDDAAYITGAAIDVDGGMLLTWMPYQKYVEAVRTG